MAERKGRRCTYKDVENFRRNKESIVDATILSFGRNRKQAIHGCRAVNAQVSERFKRPTYDYDMWSTKPEHSMDKMEDILDNKFGCDMFHEDVIPFQGIPNMLVYRVIGPDGEVVDYSLPPPGARVKKFGKDFYETLEHAKTAYHGILNNRRISYKRKLKARQDLRRIEEYEASIGRL